jgi:hypothetical protein
MLSADLYRQQNDGTNIESDLNATAFSWSSRLVSSWKLDKGWQFQLIDRYRAPIETIQGQFSGYRTADLTAQKSILKDKGTLSLRVSDIFDTRQFAFSTFCRSFEQDQVRKRESRNIYITFSYRVGKLEPSKKNRGNRGDGDSDFDDMDLE